MLQDATSGQAAPGKAARPGLLVSSLFAAPTTPLHMLQAAVRMLDKAEPTQLNSTHFTSLHFTSLHFALHNLLRTL